MVNLMKQTLTINVTQTAADTIASQIETIVHSHEPDVEVQGRNRYECYKELFVKRVGLSKLFRKIEKKSESWMECNPQW